MTERIPEQSANRGGRVYIAVLVGMVAQNVIQILLQMFFANQFGSSEEWDAYQTAITVPLNLSLMVTGTITPVLIPMLGKQAKNDASATATSVSAVVLFVTTLSAILLSFWSQPLLAALNPGFDQLKLIQTVSLFNILIWLLPANTLIGLVYAVLQANLRFNLSIIAGVVGPLTTFLFVWIAAHQKTLEVNTVAWAAVIGTLANLLVQIPAFIGYLSVNNLEKAMPVLQTLGRLSLPVAASSIVLKLDPLVDVYVLSGFYGSLSHLRYALGVSTAFITLSSGTLSTVAFPRIAKKSIAERDEFQAEVASAIRALIRLVLPAVVVLVLFGNQLVQDLLQTGEFTAEDTIIVGHAVMILSLLLVGASLGELCSKVLYSLQNVRIPLIVTAVAIGSGALLKFLLVPQSGLMTLVTINGIVFLVASLVMLRILIRMIGPQIFKGTATTFLRSAVATSLAATAGSLFLIIDMRFNSLLGLVVGGIVYLLTLWVIDTEVHQLSAVHSSPNRTEP